MRAAVAVVPTIRHAAPVVRLPQGCAFPFPHGPKYYVKGFAIFNDWVRRVLSEFSLRHVYFSFGFGSGASRLYRALSLEHGFLVFRKASQELRHPVQPSSTWGSWVVINGVISRVTIRLTHVRAMRGPITHLIYYP